MLYHHDAFLPILVLLMLDTNVFLGVVIAILILRLVGTHMQIDNVNEQMKLNETSMELCVEIQKRQLGKYYDVQD